MSRRCEGNEKHSVGQYGPEGRSSRFRVHILHYVLYLHNNNFYTILTVEVFDYTPETIPVGGYYNPFSQFYLRDDHAVPIRQSPSDRQFQRFEHGKLVLGRSVRVPRVAYDPIVVLVVYSHRWRRNVETTSPYIDLFTYRYVYVQIRAQHIG